jgi:antitoxin ParD1/3/4
MPTVTISLPDSLKGFVERQVNTKGYGNVSEYFRTLLRDAQEKERESNLEALLLEGLNSGRDIPLNAQFWKDLRSEALQMVEERRSRKKR